MILDGFKYIKKHKYLLFLIVPAFIFHMLMIYLIENNVENGSIYINCEKIKEKTILTFKDNVSNKKILETKDLLIRYDVALILRILKKLQIKINYGNKSRNFRFISLEF